LVQDTIYGEGGPIALLGQVSDPELVDGNEARLNATKESYQPDAYQKDDGQDI
jgi:hypothetical protein